MPRALAHIDAKALHLTANDYNVLEVIANCSRGDNAKGWYASMQALADYLPFCISKATIVRAVQNLLDLGLIERKEDGTLFLVQNEPLSVQNEPASVQIEPKSVQNEPNSPLPHTPSIEYINNSKIEELSSPCVPAQESKGIIFMNYPFESFLQAFPFTPNWIFTNARKADLRERWEKEYSNAKKHFIMQDLFAHEANHTRPNLCDPLTYCEKFEVPPPTFLRGDATGDLVQVRYGDRILICTRQTMIDYNLEHFADWRPHVD